MAIEAFHFSPQELAQQPTEYHLSLVDENRLPFSVELHEIALLANAFRDQQIAKQIVMNATIKLSSAPKDIQMLAHEAAGKIPRIH